MSHVFRSLLLVVLFHYSRSNPGVYEDTYNKQSIKMDKIDPERRPLYLLDPLDQIDAHYMLSIRKYLNEDVKGAAGGKLCEIKRNPTTADLEREGLWSWSVNHPSYKPTNIQISTKKEEKALYEMLTGRAWYEPAIGAERTVDGAKFTVDPFYLRLDLTPKIRQISFELPDGYEDTDITNLKKVEGLIRHPLGRTGVDGIGLLGNYLATLSADLYFIKVKKLGFIPWFNADGVHVFKLLVVDRQDGGGYASPGGVVNPGETPFEAAVREWAEEVTGATPSDQVKALKTEIENLREDIKASKVEDPLKKTKEPELNAKQAQLAEIEKGRQNEFIKDILKEILGKKDDKGRIKGFSCVYKGHAGDRRDSDKVHMETVVFAIDLTESKLDIPNEFSGSDEVKDKPRFVEINEEWLSKHKTFAKHGDYMRMILQYVIPRHSKILRYG